MGKVWFRMAGSVTLIPPTDIIKTTGETHVIDGLTYQFLYAPGSEAPAEMLYYIKEKKALNTAEDSTHTLHNTYSLRGAKIREPLPWSKYINEAIPAIEFGGSFISPGARRLMGVEVGYKF